MDPPALCPWRPLPGERLVCGWLSALPCATGRAQPSCGTAGALALTLPCANGANGMPPPAPSPGAPSARRPMMRSALLSRRARASRGGRRSPGLAMPPASPAPGCAGRGVRPPRPHRRPKRWRFLAPASLACRRATCQCAVHGGQGHTSTIGWHTPSVWCNAVASQVWAWIRAIRPSGPARAMKPCL